MARRLALSKMIVQPAVKDRSATGLALTFIEGHDINAPSLYKYGVGFEVKDNYPTKQWALCVQDADTLVDSSVAGDPDVILLPLGWTMDKVLSGGERNQANNALDTTDIGVTVSAGQTVHDMVDAILVALNHSPGAVDTIILN
jgi:hypothetical protein